MLASAQCTQLFFSEYLEGASNNKALEIYNPTGATVNMTDYVIYRANNGSPVPQDSLFPQGTLASGGVYVAGNPSAVAAILAVSDTLHTITFFNGDDCLLLKHIPSNTIIDVIGEFGVDPGTNWPVGSGATSEFTLVRMVGIQGGSTSWTQNATEYNVYPQNTDTALGVHYMTPCCIPPSISLIGQVNNPCFGDSNGSIQITASGNGPMSFSWINRPETAPVLTGLTAGTYTAVVVGACGSDTLAITITEPSAPVTQTLTASTLPGCGQFDGSLTITPSGGTPGYTYMWSNGGISATINNLSAGVYSCTVTCSNGCSSVGNYTLNNPNPPVVTVSLSMDTLCLMLSGPFSLNGESPAGGVWSGNGVNGSTFYPDSVNVGWHVITYTYTDSSNCIGFATDSVFVDICGGISGNVNSIISLSPNPFTETIQLQFATSRNVISVYNMQGEIVYSETTNSLNSTIYLSSLAPGMYTLKVENESGVMVKKIQKAE